MLDFFYGGCDFMKEKEREIQKLKEEHHLALSRISHEIRNPVTLINSSMQLIEAEHPEVLSFDLWDDMKKDMLFLRRLLDELSGYNNGEKIHPEALELSSFLREIASNARLLSPDPNIRFSTRFPEELPTINGDPVKLRQAITNLLRNAFESGATEVLFSCLCDKDGLVIQVTDNGIGISPEIQDEIFTPFVTHKKNGTGLGLPLVQRVARAHGGDITYSSGKEGTTFTFRLPTSIAASTKPAAIPPKCAI